MMGDPLLIVSADSHASAPVEEYMEFFDSPFRDTVYGMLKEEERRFMAWGRHFFLMRTQDIIAIDDQRLLRSGRARGGYELQCRLEEMDRDGIAAEVVFPGAHTGVIPLCEISNAPYPPDLRAAGRRAYHRWLVDRLLEPSGGRIFGVAYPGPCHDLDESIREMRWAAEHGFVAVGCPGHIVEPELAPLSDAYWDPFWGTASDLGLPVTIHAGYGGVQGVYLELAEMLAAYVDRTYGDSEQYPPDRHVLIEEMLTSMSASDPNAMTVINRLTPSFAPARVLTELIAGGVFDRFPALKVIPTEVGVGWLPSVLDYLDQQHAAGRLRLPMKPSEYWERNGYGAASPPKPAEIALRDRIGITRLMYGRDYPHSEGTWPNTLPWLRSVFHDFTETELRLVLGENAITCFGLDREHLLGIAQRIGPKVEDVLGEYELDPVYRGNFDNRAGFSKPAVIFDLDGLKREIDADLALVAARS